jgi:predicted alpha/beta-hydrolase family hydrolase
MQRYRDGLAKFARVVTFDYPYMALGRRSPDPLAKLVAAHQSVLAGARQDHDGPVFLVGKSMGGRVGCHLALVEPVTGVICLGYPLRSQTGKLRDQVLLELRTPVLFVQGSRDPLCPLDDLAAVRSRMTAASELHVVPGGDHSLELGKRELARLGTTQAELHGRICERIGAWLLTLI